MRLGSITVITPMIMVPLWSLFIYICMLDMWQTLDPSRQIEGDNYFIRRRRRGFSFDWK